MEKIKFEEVQGLLDSGKQLEEVFDWIGNEMEGYRIVQYHGKYNFLDSNRKLVSDTWLDNALDFAANFHI